jgi:hypothetical protein
VEPLEQRTTIRAYGVGEPAGSHRLGECQHVAVDDGGVEAKETAAGSDGIWRERVADAVEGVAQAVSGVGFVALGPKQREKALAGAAEVTGDS